MGKRVKILGWIGISLAGLAIIAFAGILFVFKGFLPNTVAKKSFPVIEGRLELEGLEASVEVIRDKMGIPHIYASTRRDLFFAQGYVHAQERFWQMDAWRHIGSGTLSEMFGKGQVETDSFLRTLDWKRIAEREVEKLSPLGKETLASYAEGVNAWLKDHEGSAASLEYSILGILSPSYKIMPWTPVNSLTWGKAMAWDLGGNMDVEIERAILLKTLGPDRLAELYPEYPKDYPVIVPRIGKGSGDPHALAKILGEATDPGSPLSAADLAAVADRLSLLGKVLGPRGPDIGSNSWAVSGKLTRSGKPLLANDMHLGIQMPSIWFQNSLHCTTKEGTLLFDVTGFSFPGVPGVMAGHNNRIAWAFTNLGPDVQDLFIEKVNPDNPGQYEAGGKWVDFETRKERIEVAGGKPVDITVLVSRHGPIISESYGSLKDKVDPKDKKAKSFKDKAGIELPPRYAVALSWTALSPASPFESVWSIDAAQNWEEFRAAARNWSVPAQNLLYADVDGNIGYQTPGTIPIRRKGDGSLPVPGWSGEYDWTGYIPFDELPWALNPESGYIATANNQANPRDYRHLISTDWDYGQRASRIVDMIKSAPGKIDAAYFRGMHGDSKSLNAEALVPILMSLTMSQDLAAIRDRYLKGWSFQETADSRAATLFESFWADLLDETFADELPEGTMPDGGSRWYVVMRSLAASPGNPWWDDKRTPEKTETRDEIFSRAFAKTIERLGKAYGKDLAGLPAWGKVHTASFKNQTLGKSGIGLIESLFNRGPYPTGGGKNIVNATGYVLGESFAVDWLPSEREIVDLGDFDASLAIHTTGQSGHAFHAHYTDMAPLWAAVEYRPMRWSKEAVAKDAEGLLELVPK